MTDITDAGPRLKAMNDRLDELRAAADQADAEYLDEIARLRLTDKEREAVERAADLIDAKTCGSSDTLRGLLARLGGCTPQLDCGADRKSVVSERCRDTGGRPFDSAPITLTVAEREAIAYYLGTGGPYGVYKTLSGLLSRTGTDGETVVEDDAKPTVKSKKLPERDRLTAAEREAIKVCESDYSDNDMDAACWKIAATLRGLLERL